MTEKKDFAKDREALKAKLAALEAKYRDSSNAATRFYYVKRLKDFLEELETYGFTKIELQKPFNRLKKVNSYGLLYDYSLAENLREQKTIITDSIQSSPMHLKKLELQNTAMVTLPEKPKH